MHLGRFGHGPVGPSVFEPEPSSLDFLDGDNWHRLLHDGAAPLLLFLPSLFRDIVGIHQPIHLAPLKL